MTWRAIGSGVLGAAVLACSCHRAEPAGAPIPVPPGEPPQVQVPVGSEPGGDSGTPAQGNAPDPQLRRYDVVAVDDTMFTILVGPGRWIRRGTTGVAVDPKRRDALVARFRVIARTGDSATVLVTGQTTRVSTADVALIRQPVPGPLEQEAFWTGLFFGVAAGVAGLLIIRR